MTYAPVLTKADIKLFNSLFTRGGVDDCWLWQGPILGKGYGKVPIGNPKLKPTYAHRMAYEVFKGPIAKGLFVCHRCDTPLCVNPKHLFLGTCKDNLADMRAKGRAVDVPSFGDRNGSRLHPEKVPRGESHGMHKLTEQDIPEIMDLHAKGISGLQIARLLSVHKKTIYKVIKGVSWKHVQPRTNKG